jgi:hypothetical protein
MGFREEMSAGRILLAGIGPAALKVLEVDEHSKVTRAKGTTVPTSGVAGYAIGCEFVKTNAANGQCPLWRNIGTTSSCLFVPVGPVIGYGIVTGGHGGVSVGGDATELLYDKDISAGDIALVEHGVCDDNDQICGAVVADGLITLTLTADPTSGAKQYNYAVLRQNIEPQWDIFAAGERACLTGDGAAVAVAVPGVLAGDIGMATYNATDDNDLVSDVVCSADVVTITVSADPGADDTHGWDYVVLRKRGSFKPSHYIFAAGIHTTVGGDDTEVITVAGALATDIAIVKWNTTDDTDTFEKAVVTADTITAVLSANPGATHALAYMLLRAY